MLGARHHHFSPILEHNPKLFWRLGLSPELTMHAIGIAEYWGPRSDVMRVMDHPTMLKDASGAGCWAGVSGAIAAIHGFTGAPATQTLKTIPALWHTLGKVTLNLNPIPAQTVTLTIMAGLAP